MVQEHKESLRMQKLLEEYKIRNHWEQKIIA